MSTWKPLHEIPADYSSEQAISDSVVVVTGYEQKVHNQEQVDRFYLDVTSGGGAGFMRVMQYTIEGDAIITDFYYDGEAFTVTHDSTRDKFSTERDRVIKSYMFQYLVPHVIPGSNTLSHYLSNAQDISSSDGYGLIEDVWWLPSPTGVE
jgi:hypothetical protein